MRDHRQRYHGDYIADQSGARFSSQGCLGEVRIPEAVKAELLRYHSEIPEFLQVCEVSDKNAVRLLRGQIDEGEAQAIILAEEIHAGALLIDDKQGRSIAEKRGLRCVGLAGALLLAKEMGVLESLRALHDDLEKRGNFYLDTRVRESLLQKAKEI